jgi:hypothetical protein
MESRTDHHAPHGQYHSDKKLDDIMVSQVNRGEDESADNMKKEIEE